MNAILPIKFRNHLLSSMQPSDLGRLIPYLEYVDLPHQLSLSEPRVVSEFTYFPECGIGSVVVSPVSGQKTEIHLFGREGLAPTSGISGTHSLPYRVFMQVAGNGHRIANAYLLAAMAESLPLRNLMVRYLQSVSVQIAYAAYSNAVHRIESRLARWLLMCHDRTEGDDIALTHEFVGIMLAIRRQSVTETLHVLEGRHLISASRGFITIRDRAGLRAMAGDAYGIPEQEYASTVANIPTKD